MHESRVTRRALLEPPSVPIPVAIRASADIWGFCRLHTLYLYINADERNARRRPKIGMLAHVKVEGGCSTRGAPGSIRTRRLRSRDMSSSLWGCSMH